MLPVVNSNFIISSYIKKAFYCSISCKKVKTVRKYIFRFKFYCTTILSLSIIRSKRILIIRYLGLDDALFVSLSKCIELFILENVMSTLEMNGRSPNNI